MSAERRSAPSEELSLAMRHVMGHFATGVAVVTARAADRTAVGTTVNALTSVSLRPPLLLVCLARDSETLAAVRTSRRFAVNVLAEHQHEHSIRFAAKGAEARSDEVSFAEHELDLPFLAGSLATIVCDVTQIHDAGDHEIVVGEALALASAENEITPLVFYRGDYSRLADHQARADGHQRERGPRPARRLTRDWPHRPQADAR